MLTNAEIIRFINEDGVSSKKMNAKKGQDYYEGEHDIKNYTLYYFDADGDLKEDKSRSNIKISNSFFTEIVDQEVQYMLSGKKGFIFSDDTQLQKKLDEYFNYNDDFICEMNELLTGAIAKGYEYIYAYKNEDMKLSFQCADSLGVVEVRAKDTQDNCDYVIYWYNERITKQNKVVRKIQVWDKTQTYYYVQDGEAGNIELDESVTENPKFHIISNEDGVRYGQGFGFIPFFRLDNNIKQTSGLKPIKALIDDYDLMNCGLSNNIQDANEYLVVVSGFQGDNLDELMNNVKTKKHIGVDEGGSVDFKTVSIPYEARKTKMEIDEKNIYRFGMAFNSALIGDGNVTNVVIKSRYALLDLKCNKLEIKLRQLLRKIVSVVIDEINNDLETAYTINDVYFEFTREVMANAQDNAQIELINAQTKQVQINTLIGLYNTESLVDKENIIKNICDVMDLDYEEVSKNLPDEIEKATNEFETMIGE